MRTDLLDDTERRKLARLVRSEDRERYVTAHALVRLLLSARTGVPAATLQLDRTCDRCGGGHGKPRLPGGAGAPCAPVAFNLAHAGNRIVAAVADGPGLDVGVDVERIPAPGAPVLDGSAALLTDDEVAVYRRLSPARRGRALAVWWTRKEAVLKATGDGLAVDPSTIEVTAPHVAPALLRGPSGDDHHEPPERARPDAPGHRPPIALRDLDAGPGYVGSVAVLGATSLEVTEHDAGPLLRAS